MIDMHVGQNLAHDTKSMPQQIPRTLPQQNFSLVVVSRQLLFFVKLLWNNYPVGRFWCCVKQIFAWSAFAYPDIEFLLYHTAAPWYSGVAEP